MTKLVNRIKQEHEENGVQLLDTLARFATKKKTIRGSIAPH